MSYCANCGAKIENTTKFCPSCGEKTAVPSQRKRRKPPKIEMDKGVIKRLKEETTDVVKSKIKKSITPKIPKEKLTVTDTVKQESHSDSKIVTAKHPIQKWMLFYVIVNILFVLF